MNKRNTSRITAKNIGTKIPLQVQRYADCFSSDEPSFLLGMQKWADKEMPEVARMCTGHFQGRLLAMLSSIIRPRCILEIGTFIGYGTLCLAEGLSINGKIHTIECNLTNAKIAKSFFLQSPLHKKIIIHEGDALTIIPTLSLSVDLVYIDAAKKNYIEYYEKVFPLVKKGGIILADNLLFRGEVLKKKITNQYAQAIHDFNQHIKKDCRVEKIMLTIRDGLMMIQKK